MSPTRFRCANSLEMMARATTFVFVVRPEKNEEVEYYDIQPEKKTRRVALIGVGFEPTPPKRLVPKTSALDRSAIQPEVPCRRVWHTDHVAYEKSKRFLPRPGIEPGSGG